MLARIADTIRALAADGVEKAKSGHPGMPLGCAEIGAVLFGEFLRHDPTWPEWPDRDRFVLSAGHGAMWLYALLHLSGYPLPLEELERFRQVGSKTPGHPEYGVVPGVETTTGPLGQGLGNAVGMALAEAMLAARFNREPHRVVDHRTWVVAGDGDMMEGVASEAASLAGHWRLGKLTVIYDRNRISIEGSTELAFTESVGERYRAYGWAVREVDGHDVAALREAMAWARAEQSRPTLIIADTHIAFKSPRQDDPESHGAPLGQEAVRALKERIGFPPDRPFFVPEEVRQAFAERRQAGRREREAWQERFARWSAEHAELRREWDAAWQLHVPPDVAERLPHFDPARPVATRVAGGQVLQALAQAIPYLVGGSADLAPSTRTYLEGFGSVGPGRFDGRNLHFGVREHGMGAILNGMSLHGGFRVFGSTFLVFSDYMRPTLRLAAMMHRPVTFVFTHDSIFVGEDGPTHQPVEHLEALRAIPGLQVFRPADAEETRAAWLAAIQRRDGPTALVLSRQNLPVLQPEADDGSRRRQEGAAHGGYVVEGIGEPVDVVLLATGSEVALAVEAAHRLKAEHGVRARVVSIPCRERFLQMAAPAHEQLLGYAPRLVIEAGVRGGWAALLRESDDFLGIERFGLSGPGPQVARELGLTIEAAVERALALVGRRRGAR